MQLDLQGGRILYINDVLHSPEIQRNLISVTAPSKTWLLFEFL